MQAVHTAGGSTSLIIPKTSLITIPVAASVVDFTVYERVVNLRARKSIYLRERAHISVTKCGLDVPAVTVTCAASSKDVASGPYLFTPLQSSQSKAPPSVPLLEDRLAIREDSPMLKKEIHRGGCADPVAVVNRPLVKENTNKSKRKGSAWALGALMDWRRKQRESSKRGERQQNFNLETVCAAGETGIMSEDGVISGCSECESCSIGPGLSEAAPNMAPGNEAPMLNVKHDAQSFSDFLFPVPLQELRTVALMSVLCDMAYTVPTLNPNVLLRQHRLHIVSSSIQMKLELAIQEKAMQQAREKEKSSEKSVPSSSVGVGNDSNLTSGKFSPEVANALASAAVSYLSTQSKAVDSLKQGSHDEQIEDTASHVVALPASAAVAATLAAPLDGSLAREKDFREEASCFDVNISEDSKDSKPVSDAIHVTEQEQSLCSSILSQDNSAEMEMMVAAAAEAISRSTSLSDVVDSIELSEEAEREAAELLRANKLASSEKPAAQAAKAEVAKEPLCPCEWFAADDADSYTRYFVIQGSDSLASWQTNVTFDPVPFEDPVHGVLVHRGIYEAARALYRQVLPLLRSHVAKHGTLARLRFTGHSLGGSLATLLSLMLQVRGEIAPGVVQEVYTFGSPSITCGGDQLLETLGLPAHHIKQVVMHRDLVPRVFACNYPNHIAEVLRRLSGSFRDHPCLQHQKLLYAPIGTMLVLQPDEKQAPHHPLLPAGSGLYHVRHPSQNEAALQSQAAACRAEVRAAQRALLNSPHPLEILADPASYGSDGGISRHHDPRSYMRAVHLLLRHEARSRRRVQRQQRRQLWWPLVGAEASARASGQGLAVNMPAETPRVGAGAAASSRVGSYARFSSYAGARAAAGSFLSQAGGGMGDVATAAHCNAGGSGAGGVNGVSRRCRSLIASQHIQLGLLAVVVYPFLSQSLSIVV